MFLMKPEDVDRQIRQYRRYMLAGACLIATGIFLSRKYDVFFGVTSGTMAVMLGAAGGACHTWRREKGIWMVSVLFFLPSMAFYIMFEIMQWATVGESLFTFRSALSAADLFISTWFLLKQVRFLASVTLHNWRLSRQVSDASGDGP